MAFWSVKDFTTGVAAKIASFIINVDQNVPMHAVVDSTGAEVIGTRADAVWDGSAASPSGHSLWHYAAAKLEAIRALLASPLAVALPSGASTAANQTTNGGKLDTLHADLVTLNTDLATTLHNDLGLSGSIASKVEAVRALLAGTIQVSGVSFQGGDASAANQALQLTQATSTNSVLGATDGAAIVTDVAGTIQQYLRGLVKLLAGTLTVGLPSGASTAANQTLQVTQETAINAVLGTKADAVWDGSTASPTGHSLWHYAATKLEAIRALLAGGITVATHAVTNAGTFAVQVSSSILPTGAATAALQTTGNTALTALSALIANGKLPVFASIDPASVLANVQGASPVTITANVLTATSNGGTQSRINSTANTNLNVMKTAAGQLYTLDVFNSAAYPVFLKLYNKTTAPVLGTDVPVTTIPVQAGGGYSKTWPMGLPFSTGIAYAITKFQGDADNAAIAAGDLTGNALWM